MLNSEIHVSSPHTNPQIKIGPIDSTVTPSRSKGTPALLKFLLTGLGRVQEYLACLVNPWTLLAPFLMVLALLRAVPSRHPALRLLRAAGVGGGQCFLHLLSPLHSPKHAASSSNFSGQEVGWAGWVLRPLCPFRAQMSSPNGTHR